MKHLKKILSIFSLALIGLSPCHSQEDNTGQSEKLRASLNVGFFSPILSESGVMFSNAIYDPNVGSGFSFGLGIDHPLNNRLSIGLAVNGNHANGEFIRNADINGQLVDGYLEAGLVSNMHFLANLRYILSGEGIRPFAQLGVGFFNMQVEMGDVPLALTDNIEVEMFPDYKYSGIGFLPRIGVSKDAFSLSAGYSLPMDDLTGEKVPGFNSPGTVTSHGFQIDLSYSINLL